MAFRVQARTLLQLGSELISSDAIALYELIKNASDSGAPYVDVTVGWRLNDWPGDYRELIDATLEGEISMETLRKHAISHTNLTSKDSNSWLENVRNAKDAKELCQLIRSANYIHIADRGHGMSFDDLEKIYLTIGTPNRLIERRAADEENRKIQGEKGLGRLSTMRLGDELFVKTSRSGEPQWNSLHIDWSRFEKDLCEMVEDIDVAPTRDASKSDSSEKGTTIHITNLKAHWSEKRLKEYAEMSLSRITDPFLPMTLFRVNLRFNDEKIVVERMDTDILKMAHAKIEAEFVAGGTADKPQLKLRGTVDYHEGEIAKKNTFYYDDLTHLSKVIGGTPAMAFRLGSFTMRAYWFNRGALKKVPNGPEYVERVNRWSGGLMLFRDGYRVHPYASPEDDWLSLDKKALASAGYKVNRKQIIGKVDITSRGNPALTDQTNREGLRDCPEKTAMVNILKHIFAQELHAFLNSVSQAKQRDLESNVEALTSRAKSEGAKLKENFSRLKRLHPEVVRESELVLAIDGAMDELETILKQANEAANAANAAREQLVHLAGLGLMVEMLAHELNRSTQFALGVLSDARDSTELVISSKPLRSLELQLKTISQRLRTLDPATTSGRHRKETFDLVTLAHEIAAGHEGEFARHSIKCQVYPKLHSEKLMVKMVKGMVVQVLENLLSNSLYWLKAHQKINDDFKPHIEIEIDTEERALRITDNGPGVTQEIRPRLFTPFFTTKPADQGKGLGLFISRDIAKYHDCTLELSSEHRTHKDRFNTFILRLPQD